MSMLSIFQNIRTLRIKFLAIVLPSIVFCFIVFSIIFAFLTYRDMEIQLDTETRKIADLQSKALALPLWNYLDQDVKQTLETLLLNPDVIKAVVRDTKGRVIARAGKADDKGIYKGEVQIEREITFQFVPTGAKRTIGYLAITFHRGRIYEILYKQFIRDSFLLLLLVIAIVGSALAADKLAIEIPLYRLLRAIRKADEENVRETVHWPARDELGQVIKAYNSLIESLKVAEKSLKEHSEHLEEMVEQRTKELREVQETLVHKEKLAVIGELSGNISHELKNPLGVIDSSVYYLKMRLKDVDQKVEEHLDRIKSAVENSVTVIGSLTHLTRMKEPKLERLDLIDITSKTIAISNLPETVNIVEKFPDEDILIHGDPEQLSMTFKNIINNAVASMDERGTLMVTICRTNEDQAEVSFADTGPGISQENLERVFQPLFTTRAKGIGFGLSIAKMVIEKHRGTIDVKSKQGSGATFTIHLPVNIDKIKEN